jgi:hypothetical protein
MVVFGSGWLIIGFGGCSGPQMQPVDVSSQRSPAHRSTTVEARQLEPFLAQLSQLQMATEEALDAAELIGTPDHDLAAAQQDYASAKQWLRAGTVAYQAMQYESAWNTLRAADAAFRQAEEAAVGAGLRQLERELAADYERLLTTEAGAGPRPTAVAHVSQESVHLRDGAGTQFQVIGEVQFGDTLEILAEAGEWYRVRVGTGLTGWVSKMSVRRVHSP